MWFYLQSTLEKLRRLRIFVTIFSLRLMIIFEELTYEDRNYDRIHKVYRLLFIYYIVLVNALKYASLLIQIS